MDHINPDNASIGEIMIKLSDSLIASSESFKYSLANQISITDKPGAFLPINIFYNVLNE